MLPFLNKRKGPVLSREQSMASMPLRNPMLTESVEDDGIVRLAIPRKEAWWVKLLSRVFYVPKRRRIALDELGSFVWQQCDGETTVRTLIDKFCKKYKLNRKEAEVSMVAYLRQLAKKGLIGIQVPKDVAPGVKDS